MLAQEEGVRLNANEDWSKCSICSIPLVIDVNRRGKESSGSGHLYSSSSSSNQILLKYFLSRCDDNELKESLETSSNNFGLCNSCDNSAKEIQHLHLQLEVIQMKLIDKLRQLTKLIVTNSGTYSGEKDGNKLICRLHQVVRDNARRQISIPFVFLEKLTGSRDLPIIVSSTSLLPVPSSFKENTTNQDQDPESKVLEAFVKVETDFEPSLASEIEVNDSVEMDFMNFLIKTENDDDSPSSKSDGNPKVVCLQQKSRKVRRKNYKVRLPLHHRKCHECPEILGSGESLLRHNIRVHNHPKLQCEECPPLPGKYFRSYKGLNHHLKISHPKKTAETYPCFQCPKEFFTKQRRYEHQEAHVTSRNYKCDICGFATTTNRNLLKHRRRQHKAKYNCERCDEVFPTFHKLKMHISCHEKATTFTCSVCGEHFRHKASVSRHMKRKHEGEKDIPKKSKKKTSL